MPPRSHRTATEPPPEPPAEIEPPYYEAAQDLYVYNPESGAVPQLAYRKGDRVVPDVVEPNGWQGQVTVPAHFEGQLTVPAAPEPDAGGEAAGDAKTETAVDPGGKAAGGTGPTTGTGAGGAPPA
jgi:hypothetical protein